jgi:RNA polymerase sigma-70 factor (ECF subfamily)
MVHSPGEERCGNGREQDWEPARLVTAIAEGNRAAESAFVCLYQPRVRTMLVIRSKNPDLARDLLQDVMIEALCALRKGQLRESDKLAAFVAGIARNLLNAHFRGQTRAPVLEELPDELAAAPVDERELQSEERRRLAGQAISTLESVDRRILHMTLVDDLKPGVIARRLGLNPELVRQRKLRATRRVMEFVRRASQTSLASHKEAGEWR